ncbi:MAG: DUF11 domain-containing protein [Clostridia bacterium]|nr:DUF11 domain-containing protein [Clostridia bacterium]
MAEIMNNATVNFTFSGSSEEFSETSNTTTVTLNNGGNLSITKTAQQDTYVPGGTVTYIVTITNNGPYWFSGVRLTDDLSGNGYLTYVNGSALLYINGQALSPQIASTSPLVFTLSPLSVGESMVLTYTCRVPLNIAPNVDSITNTASGIGYTFDSTAEDSDSVTITRSESANLSINKTSSESNVNVGQTFSYFITLTNSGNSVANVSSIVDDFPSNFQISSVSLKIGSGPNNLLNSSDYTISPSNVLTVPSATGPSITVPAVSGGTNGTTVLTITGNFTSV